MNKNMKTFIRISILLIIFAILSSCYIPYKKYNNWDGTGYQETFYAPDVVSVSYTGGSNTTFETVSDFAMLRAAELALQNNYKYFVVNSTKDLTKQKVSTSAGSSTTVEKTTQKGKTEVKTSETQYNPPSTSVSELPKILLEVQFFNTKPANATVYESSFINNSIKSKYKITDE